MPNPVPSNHIFRRFRDEEHLSQPQFAEMLNIPQQGHVSHYELGRRPVPLKLAYRFIKFARAHGYMITLEDVYPDGTRPARKATLRRKRPAHA